MPAEALQLLAGNEVGANGAVPFVLSVKTGVHACRQNANRDAALVALNPGDAPTAHDLASGAPYLQQVFARSDGQLVRIAQHYGLRSVQLAESLFHLAVVVILRQEVAGAEET